MKRRGNWEELPVEQVAEANFLWKPVSIGLRFDRLQLGATSQIVNHVEGHKELSHKDRLLQNMALYCSTHDLNVFDYTPVTYAFELYSSATNVEILRFTHMFRALGSSNSGSGIV
jgi:hypothetical protein